MPGRAPSIRACRFTRLAFFLAALPLAAAAEDLLQVYRDAQRYDSVYAAARQNLAAGRERLPQGRALLLPTLNLSGNATRSRIEVESDDPTLSPSFTRRPVGVASSATV